MTKVLCCGGRVFGEFKDSKGNLRCRKTAIKERWLVHESLMEIGPSYIIQGFARGADTMGWKWADENGILHSGDQFKANWHPNGVFDITAGFSRNQDMLDIGEPDIAVAFQGGNGTADMIGRCNKAGIEVIQPLFTNYKRFD